MPGTCFSYSADAPPDTRNANATQPARPDLRRMPYSCFGYPVWACFSYPADVPRSVPGYPCFAYPGDMPLDSRNRGAAQWALRGLRRMPQTCFNY